MIAQAFLKCGISNAMDGTQDDAIYDGDILAAQATTDKDDDSDELNDSVPKKSFVYCLVTVTRRQALMELF